MVVYICNPNLPICPTLPFPVLCVHMLILYICTSFSALQIGLSVPFFLIPYICFKIQYLFKKSSLCWLLFFSVLILVSRHPLFIWTAESEDSCYQLLLAFGTWDHDLTVAISVKQRSVMIKWDWKHLDHRDSHPESTLLLFFSRSVVSNSLQPHGLQHARLPCPSLSPGIDQIHVHWVGDAIEPFHPLLPSFPVTFQSLPQHQGLFQWVNSSHQVAKVLELQHQSFQWIFRVDVL